MRIAIICAALVACDPPPPEEPVEPARPIGPAPAGEKPLPGYELTWSQLGQNQRARLMRDWVLPTAGDLFRRFDGERYADFTCATCHGDRPAARDYAMPNPQLLPLAFGPGSGYDEVKRRKAELVAFMKDQLSPQMAELLGKQKWSESTPAGFGCWSCHPKTDKIPRTLISP